MQSTDITFCTRRVQTRYNIQNSGNFTVLKVYCNLKLHKFNKNVLDLCFFFFLLYYHFLVLKYLYVLSYVHFDLFSYVFDQCLSAFCERCEDKFREIRVFQNKNLASVKFFCTNFIHTRIPDKNPDVHETRFTDYRLQQIIRGSQEQKSDWHMCRWRTGVTRRSQANTSQNTENTQYNSRTPNTDTHSSTNNNNSNINVAEGH